MKYSLFNNVFYAFVVTMMATGAFAQSFVIKGSVKGVRNGTKVALRFRESGMDVPVSTLTKGDSFELKGTVKSPTLVTLEINEKPDNQYAEGEYPQSRGINFMLENANYTVSATCIDSVPRTFDLGVALLRQAPNMTILGGEAQRQYNEWFQATYKQQLAEDIANTNHHREKYMSGRKRWQYDTVKVNQLAKVLDEARSELVKANNDFIAAHPDYAISLLLQQNNTSNPFCYTVQELDSLQNLFSNNYDKVRLASFEETLNTLKKYPRQAVYRDMELQNTDGSKIQLSNCIVKGKYNFIDCWASWCGPCRAAIPRVKDMYNRFSGKVNIVSISVDKKNEDWLRAVKEENMPWRQLIVPVAELPKIRELYMLRFVPTLMIVDPEGKIQMYTSDPDAARNYLEQHVK